MGMASAIKANTIIERLARESPTRWTFVSVAVSTDDPSTFRHNVVALVYAHKTSLQPVRRSLSEARADLALADCSVHSSGLAPETQEGVEISALLLSYCVRYWRSARRADTALCYATSVSM